jgi:hypothetical protein
MARLLSKDCEAGAVSTKPCIPGEIPPGQDLSPTSNYPSSLQDTEIRPFLWPGSAQVETEPEGQNWTSARPGDKGGSQAATWGFHEQEVPCTRAQDEQQRSTKHPTTWEMTQYTLSRLCAALDSRREQVSIYIPHGRDSRDLDHPSLIRCQSSHGGDRSGYPSASGRRSQPRRWSVCTLAKGASHYAADGAEVWAPTVDDAIVRLWCEEFHGKQVQEWHQMVADFGMAWKQWCFAQRRGRFWADDRVKQAIKQFWQPYNDFDYVLSVYSFLEGAGDCNLLPHLRPVYMAWRSPEQTRFHEGCDLASKEDWSLDKSVSSCDTPPLGDCPGAVASRYPLTSHQHLRVARICGAVGEQLRGLQYWLNMFRNYRRALTEMAASNDAVIPSAATAGHRWHLNHAATQFSSLAKTLSSRLRDSRISLCEALGLDPDQVPGGDTDLIPTMITTGYERAVGPRRPGQGQVGPALPPGFGLKRASLQASRLALKANLYLTLLPYDVAQRILGRMMTRSSAMAALAREAGDDEAEAKMRRLHNRIREVSERTDQESPSFKPRMTLLDSETWPAVLKPREDMCVEIQGDISLPVETLIDILHAQQVPASTPGGTAALGTDNRSESGGSTLGTPLNSTCDFNKRRHRHLSTSSSTAAAHTV